MRLQWLLCRNNKCSSRNHKCSSSNTTESKPAMSRNTKERAIRPHLHQKQLPHWVLVQQHCVAVADCKPPRLPCHYISKNGLLISEEGLEGTPDCPHSCMLANFVCPNSSSSSVRPCSCTMQVWQKHSPLISITSVFLLPANSLGTFLRVVAQKNAARPAGCRTAASGQCPEWR